MTLLKLVIRACKPYWFTIIFIFLFEGAQTIANLFLPTFNAQIIDEGVVTGDMDFIFSHGGLMLGVSAVQVICAIIGTYCAAKVAMAVGRDIRQDAFDHIETLSTKEISAFGAPTLITRTTNDVKQIQELVLMFFLFMVSAPILCVGAIILAMRQDEKLSLIIWIMIPIVIISMIFFMRYLIPLFRKMQDQIDKVNKIVREQIIGMEVIRAFVKDEEEQGRFDKASVSLADTNLKVGRTFGTMMPFFMLCINLGSVAVIWFGAERVQEGGIGIGSLTAFLSYIVQVFMAIGMAMFMIMMVPRAAVGADRITEVLETQPSVAQKTDAKPLEIKDSVLIDYDEVSYKYPAAEKEVLRNISFTTARGEMTAIVGSTGAGKTTLLNLLPRLIDPTRGSISINEKKIGDVTLDSLRSKMAIVPQKAFLFAGTIKSNMQIANDDATDEKIWEALEMAQAADFVGQLEGGLEADVEAGGRNFSGGQKQRLCIARALLAHADINLFDDSFSALDYATDAKLRAALVPVRQNSAMIVVAQRVSSIMDADQILVLDQGSLVGKGTHDELMEHCLEYQEIVESQLTAEEAA